MICFIAIYVLRNIITYIVVIYNVRPFLYHVRIQNNAGLFFLNFEETERKIYMYISGLRERELLRY